MRIIGGIRRGLLLSLLLEVGLAVRLNQFAQSFVQSLLETSKNGSVFQQGSVFIENFFPRVQLESPLLQFVSIVFPSPTKH